jgi:hypothetical protein
VEGLRREGMPRGSLGISKMRRTGSIGVLGHNSRKICRITIEKKNTMPMESCCYERAIRHATLPLYSLASRTLLCNNTHSYTIA